MRVYVAESAVTRTWGGLTEFSDLVDSLYDALPDWLKNREYFARHKNNPRLMEKLRLIYQNFRYLNASKAVRNIIENELKDQAFGRLGKAAQKGYNRRVRRGLGTGTHGPGLGPLH